MTASRSQQAAAGCFLAGVTFTVPGHWLAERGNRTRLAETLMAHRDVVTVRVEARQASVYRVDVEAACAEVASAVAVTPLAGAGERLSLCPVVHSVTVVADRERTVQPPAGEPASHHREEPR